MRSHIVSLAALAAGAVFAAQATPAAAADYGHVPPPTLSTIPFDVLFTLTLTSDYISRGVTQTDHKPAVQGSAEIDYGIFYGGIWASNVDFGDNTTEIDLSLGVRPTWNQIGFDFGYVRYVYNDPDTDAGEFYVFANFPATEALSIGGKLYVNPDNGATYIEGNAAYTLPNNFKLSGAVGAINTDGGTDYVAWNAGISYTFNDNITFDVRYWDSSLSTSQCGGNQCDARIVASVTFATALSKLGMYVHP